MKQTNVIYSKLRQLWGVSLGAVLLAYFAFSAVSGEYGISHLEVLDQEVSRLEEMSDLLAYKQEKLERRVASMRGEALDPDLLEEEVRATLGFAHPDEIILLMP